MIYLLGLLIIIVLILFMYLTKKPVATKVSGFKSYLDQKTRDDVARQIVLVDELLSLGKPSQLKQGIIEMDKTLNLVLDNLYPNENFVLKMKNIKEKFENREEYNDLWTGHKIRNLIVHAVNQDLPATQLKNALINYKKSLNRLMELY